MGFLQQPVGGYPAFFPCMHRMSLLKNPFNVIARSPASGGEKTACFNKVHLKVNTPNFFLLAAFQRPQRINLTTLPELVIFFTNFWRNGYA